MHYHSIYVKLFIVRMKILVTGGNGFLGKHLVKRLRNNGDIVEVFDLPDDIRNYSLLKKRTKGYDLVWHAAAIADLNYARGHDDDTFDINVQGTINVAKACSENGIKLNYFSTCCVYGNQKIYPTDELSPTYPSEIYADTKLMGEYAILSYKDISNLKFNIVRLATIYGPGMREALGVHIFFTQAMKNKPITVHGNGKQTRSITYVEDLIDGLEKITYFKGNGEIINIAAQERISAIDMAKRIKKITKSKSKIVHIPQRPGQTFIEEVSSKKAKKLIKWESKTSFDEGLEKTYEWFKNN